MFGAHNMYNEDLIECSCFIEFIKRVEESIKIQGLPIIKSPFLIKFAKFNSETQMLNNIYHTCSLK